MGRKGRYQSRMALAAAVLSASCLLGGCGIAGTDHISDMIAETADSEEMQETIDIRTMPVEETPQKNETVHISADATGTAEEISVEVTLGKTDESGLILDQSSLSDIVNKRGDELCAFEDILEEPGMRRVYWQNAGEDITYEGTADMEPPVEVRVSYYLDGRRIAPEKLAGKSGRVRIRFDYKNQASEKVTVDGTPYRVQVPFAVISMVTLSNEHFSDVTIENGRLIPMGEQMLLAGYAFPGLKSSLQLKDMEAAKDIEIPDYVEISAEVTDFSLDYTAHIITNGLLADADLEKLDDAKKLSDGIDDLMDASDRLVAGMRELSDGSAVFGQYLEEYTAGASDLYAGMHTLSEGTNKLNTSVREAADALSDELDTWDKSLSLIREKLPDASLEDVQKFAGQAASVQESVQSAYRTLSAIDWDAADEDVLRKMAQEQAASAISQAIDRVEIDGLDEEQKMQLEEQLGQLADEILTSDFDFSEALPKDEIKEVEKAALDLQHAAEEFSGLEEAVAALQALYDDNEDILTESMQTLSKDLPDTETLKKQIDLFADSVDQISSGARQLEAGTGQMAEAGKTLTEGYESLTEGANALYGGMKAFDRDGIRKLSDLGGADLKKLAGRLQALQKADQAYTNYSGITEGTKGSVRFILETEPVR